MKRKIKFGDIAEPMAPSRGALPVRQWHRKDESKILATKRLGIDLEDWNDWNESVLVKIDNQFKI